jgi:hypothetical protein
MRFVKGIYKRSPKKEKAEEHTLGLKCDETRVGGTLGGALWGVAVLTGAEGKEEEGEEEACPMWKGNSERSLGASSYEFSLPARQLYPESFIFAFLAISGPNSSPHLNVPGFSIVQRKN